MGYYNLGLYFQEIGDKVKALENIEKAYQIDSKQKLIVLSLKKLYLNLDKADQAKQVLENYLEEFPDDEEIKQMLEGMK